MLVAILLAISGVLHLSRAGEWTGPKWNEQTCGKSKFSDAGDGMCLQVIEGCLAREHEFPWQVFYTYARGAGHFACGGTIISECYVLTAAHCLTTYDADAGTLTNIPPQNYSLRIGEHLVFDNTVPIVERGAIEIIPHPDYDPVTKAYDIGLIRLDTPIEFNEDITAICPPDPTSLYADEIGYVVGWGHYDNENAVNIGQFSNQLRYGLEDILAPDDSLCMEPDTKFMCFRDLNTQSVSACTGDNGGGVLVKDTTDGCFRQVGVISFTGGGTSCVATETQGATRITQETLDWIATC